MKISLRVVLMNAGLIEMLCCSEKKMECVIRGYMYHVYKAICAAAITKDLVCTREATNVVDKGNKCGQQVHCDGNERRNHHWTLTKENSKVCSMLLQRGGSIFCKFCTLNSDRSRHYLLRNFQL